MQPRSTRILDAAIQVAGADGIRALTHRAVDAAAGLPAGSTSNHFRTREALLRGMASRIVDTELAGWDDLAAGVHPSSVDDVADVLASMIAMLTGPMRVLTAARYALFVEATRDPLLQAEIDRAAVRIAGIGAQWLAHAGSPDPAGHAQIMMALADGLLIHELALPSPDRDIAAALRTVLRSLVAR